MIGFSENVLKVVEPVHELTIEPKQLKKQMVELAMVSQQKPRNVTLNHAQVCLLCKIKNIHVMYNFLKGMFWNYT